MTEISFTDHVESCYDRHDLIAWWDQQIVANARVIVAGAAKVQYDGHLFVSNPTPRTAAKQSPWGRVLPFWHNERPSLPNFAPCCQPGQALCRWVPGDWPSPGTHSPTPTPWLLGKKRPPKMDALTLNADLDHHLIKTNSRGPRPISAAAYTMW